MIAQIGDNATMASLAMNTIFITLNLMGNRTPKRSDRPERMVATIIMLISFSFI
jgi:hypothetical protein